MANGILQDIDTIRISWDEHDEGEVVMEQQHQQQLTSSSIRIFDENFLILVGRHTQRPDRRSPPNLRTVFSARHSSGRRLLRSAQSGAKVPAQSSALSNFQGTESRRGSPQIVMDLDSVSCDG